MRLCITAEVLAKMIEDTDRWAPKETGGVVMGYLHCPSEIVVTSLIGAGPNAKHYRCGFVPDYDYQESEIARLYRDSGRYWTYLGDWHSHPGGTSRLSKLDRRTLRDIARTPEARIPNPLMIIIHDHHGTWQATAYQRRWGITRITIHEVAPGAP